MVSNQSNNYKYIFKTITVLILFFVTFSLSGCNRIEKLKVKFGLKNEDFEYIKENKVKKIIIQNTRDKGFRFIVSDKKVIGELYDIMSSAKEIQKKSNLEPDYVFEMDEGNGKTHKFNYIAGLNKKDEGNLYSKNKVYAVSKRIDNDIIKSFWTIRKPKNFKDVYYSSIIETLKKQGISKNNKSNIGINIQDDIDVAKFILSTDLEEFKSNLKNSFNNIELIKDVNKKYDKVVDIKTEGYKSTRYKALISFNDKKKNTEKKYYIINEYKNGSWDLKIYDEKPEEF